MDLIISVSGLRGIIGDSLTPDVAIRYAGAFAAELPPGPVVVTRDPRGSGRMLAGIVCGALQATGRNVIDGGMCATPTTGILVRNQQAAGGVQVSASHNPRQYNGLKLFNADGRVIPADAGQQVLKRYHENAIEWAGHDRLGSTHACDDTISRHLESVLQTVDVERIRRARFKVFLDANHGAASIVGRPLLTRLGCDVLGCDDEQPDGEFDHDPEPTAANLAGISARVRESSADVGFCQDPDADRLAIINERGHYIGEEYTLAICVEHVLPQRPGPIVTNCASSRMCENLADRHGVPFFRSAVGEANVVDCMLSNGAVFGGEGNGGPIDPRVGLVRDSFVGMALVLDAMAARNESVGQIADKLPRYHIHKAKLAGGREQLEPLIDELLAQFPEAQCSRLDGVRFDWPDKWLLVRPSNTEPISRVIAEATSQREAERLCQEVAQLLESTD